MIRFHFTAQVNFHRLIPLCSVKACVYICSPDVTSSEVFSVHFAKGSPEQRVFEAQSARDWETFLSYRAKELVPGKVYIRFRYTEDLVLDDIHYFCYSMCIVYLFAKPPFV